MIETISTIISASTRKYFSKIFLKIFSKDSGNLFGIHNERFVLFHWNKLKTKLV